MWDLEENATTMTTTTTRTTRTTRQWRRKNKENTYVTLKLQNEHEHIKRKRKNIYLIWMILNARAKKLQRVQPFEFFFLSFVCESSEELHIWDFYTISLRMREIIHFDVDRRKSYCVTQLTGSCCCCCCCCLCECLGFFLSSSLPWFDILLWLPLPLFQYTTHSTQHTLTFCMLLLLLRCVAVAVAVTVTVTVAGYTCIWIQFVWVGWWWWYNIFVTL